MFHYIITRFTMSTFHQQGEQDFQVLRMHVDNPDFLTQALRKRNRSGWRVVHISTSPIFLSEEQSGSQESTQAMLEGKPPKPSRPTEFVLVTIVYEYDATLLSKAGD